MLGVAPSEVVLRNICSNGCQRRPKLDLTISYAFETKSSDTNKARVFFVPHPLTPDGYYTQAQLEEIERTLACHGFDLLPLDYNVH
jgi:hypothetical protein